EAARAGLEPKVRATFTVYKGFAEDPGAGVLRVVESPEAVRTALGAVDGVKIGRAGEVVPLSFTAPGGREPGQDATWFAVGGFRSVFRLVLDPLSGLLVLVVLGVGSLIHLYSIAYMGSETPGGFARYFAYLNLFTAMMLVL